MNEVEVEQNREELTVTTLWWESLGVPMRNCLDVLITPDLARKWLATRNKGNRPMMRKNVDRYSLALRRGEWMMTGESIVFGRDGMLLTGQHRLQACVETGISFRSSVFFDIDPLAKEVIDSGKPQSDADRLAKMGISAAKTAAAAARLLNRHVAGKPLIGNNRSSASTSIDTLRAIERYPRLESAAVRANANDFRPFLPASVVAFMTVVTAEIDVAKSELFLHQLETGIGLEEGMPVYVLRKRLLSAKNDRRMRLKESERLAITFIAWNCFRKNRKIKVLTFRSADGFPAIDGDVLRPRSADAGESDDSLGSEE
jgi:hypothetical protein